MTVYRVVEYHYEGDATTLGTFDSREKAERCKSETLAEIGLEGTNVEDIRIHEVPVQ